MRRSYQCLHKLFTKKRFFSALAADVQQEVDQLFRPHQVSNRLADLEAHGKDESFHPIVPPQLLIYPESTEQISSLMKLCHKSATPVIPFGCGTSLEGHVSALKGGISLDLTRMNKILEVAKINEEDFNCRVEAGVTRKALNEALKGTGLFFSVDPGADATLGGMMATRASGTNTVKFGTMRENVLGCQAVLANGEIIKTGSKAVKSSSGYDLTHLLCGSEGTLAVITELIVKLHPHPEEIAAAICAFPSMKAAVESASSIIQNSISVARIELLDESSIAAINSYSKMNLSQCPTLFFEIYGTKTGVKEQADQVSSLVKEFDGTDFDWAVNQEDRNQLWKARHSAYWAILSSCPQAQGFLTDICVPISKLTECLLYTQQSIKYLLLYFVHNALLLCFREAGLNGPIVGHVGDGNFHAVILVNPDDSIQIQKAKSVSNSIVMKALQCGGTCTGEHGIGRGKLQYLVEEHGPSSVNLMHTIKKAIDPQNILNPGKLGSRLI